MKSRTLQTAFLALGLASLFYGLQHDVRLDWADEGFYWYGVTHARLGEVPIRDFEAYDPGRYYWGAAFSFLFGSGINGVRIAASFFQALCLFFGLSAMRRAVPNRAALAGIGILSGCWMLWNFRYFDAGLAMAAVWIAARLVEKPDSRRHFEAGLASGVAIFFGLNHGLYFLGSFGALLFYCRRKGLLEKIRAGAFSAGFAAGLLPIIGMGLFVTGFFETYAARFLEFGNLLAEGRTNFPLVPPPPWTMAGAAFVAAYLFYGVSAFALFSLDKERLRSNPLYPAAVFTGLFYFHHALSRADLTHLGEAFFPVIAGLFSAGLLARSPRKAQSAAAALLAVLTAFSAVPAGNLLLKIRASTDKPVLTAVGGARIRLPESNARLLEIIRKAVSQNVPAEKTLLIAPRMTTLYSALEKASPVWEIYFLWPASEKLEKKLIEQMEGVDWALVSDGPPPDSRPELQFCATHPRLCGYLAERFSPVAVEGLPADFLFLRRNDAADA